MIPYRIVQVRVSQTDLEGWSAGKEDGVLSVTGACPRCGHDTRSALLTEHVEIESLLTQQEPPGGPLNFQITRSIDCACSEAHPKPANAVTAGCGASWAITAKQSQATWVVEAGDARVVAAAHALATEAATNDLKAIRATAAKWLAGVAALYGLFSLSGAVVGKDTVDKLATSTKIAIASLLFIALVAAVASVVSGYLAAYGWPKNVTIENDADLRVWFEQRSTWNQQQLAGAVESLHRSVYAAVAALAALSVALGLLWLGPTASAASPLIRVTYTRGGISGPLSVCGKLDSLTANSVMLDVTEGPRTNPQTIPVASINKTELVDSC